ncbi:MAG: class I SAM-dependent methyltransferase [Gloeomargarita sp. SKYG98]|nr:class I SAM-dependent methyltransferase [Gloeomargarita sp. SKYG98]
MENSPVVLPPEQLAITLVEPDVSYRRRAVQQLLPYSRLPVTHDPQLPTDLELSFHLILCNHVLYYVPDLRQTPRQLLQARHPQGLFLAERTSFVKCGRWVLAG